MNKVIKINSLTFSGVNVTDVQIQAQLLPGIPSFIIVGLADKTIAESRERVRAALVSIGLGLPQKKILVNLAPADLVKEGSHFDLPIACALLAALGIIPAEELLEYLILGELGLDGTILSVSGALPAAVGANSRDLGLICPKVNGKEAVWSGNNKIIAPGNLLELINHFKGTQILRTPEINTEIDKPSYLNLKDIRGQKHAKRVLEITLFDLSVMIIIPDSFNIFSETETLTASAVGFGNTLNTSSAVSSIDADTFAGVVNTKTLV